jgi:peptide deformylase
MGDPRLLDVARPVEAFDTPELHRLVGDMKETMLSENGVGLAAPQIGESLRIVVFGFDAGLPEAEELPYTVLINPVLAFPSEETEDDWEGCLSLPGLRARIPRRARLRYTGFTLSGERIERDAEGFHARVVQHECDHLDGILYPMRIVDFRSFGYTDVLFPESSASNSVSS